MNEHRFRIGERIRCARQKLGLSQTTLAKRLGDDSGQLQQMEAGEASPTPALARQLSAELGVSTAWLLGIEEVNARNEANRREQLIWAERVVEAVLTEGDIQTPPRSAEASARLIAYFVAHPDRVFEIEVYEERVRALRARAGPRAAVNG